RVQELARAIVEHYGADTTALWTDGNPDGAEVLRRLKALPGFGEQKAKIFLALLGKQYGATPRGWRAAAGDYGKAGAHMSVADVVDKESLDQVRAYKKKMKAAAKSTKEKR
ncbi:MAG: Fe-S cluster assembly protein HesB, partial [Mycobacterium sp.]|nr:Fe-S cluster assembly protein HesB [Mycobacterium sp.]